MDTENEVILPNQNKSIRDALASSFMRRGVSIFATLKDRFSNAEQKKKGWVALSYDEAKLAHASITIALSKTINLPIAEEDKQTLRLLQDKLQVLIVNGK